jgi:hypothetical protein
MIERQTKKYFETLDGIGDQEDRRAWKDVVVDLNLQRAKR